MALKAQESRHNGPAAGLPVPPSAGPLRAGPGPLREGRGGRLLREQGPRLPAASAASATA